MGAWKVTDHKHTQAANNGVRLQASLGQATQREQAASLVVAQAEKAKRAATGAMARAEGLGLTTVDESTIDGSKDKRSPKCALSWDQELFNGLGDLECE